MDWYVSRRGARDGPYTDPQIRALIRKGEVAWSDLAWRFGLSGWIPLSKIAELRTEDAPAMALQRGQPSTPRPFDEPPPATERATYLKRHWRGEFSLPMSFWVNGNLLSLLMVAVVTLVAASDYAATAPRWFSAGGVAYWSLLIALTLWQLVGVWRSASRHLLAGCSKGWARLAKAIVVFSTVVSIFSVATFGAPQMVEFAQLAMGRDPIGTYQLRILHRGTELEMSGAITFGLADEIAKALDQNPTVKIIRLQSQGGRVVEARRLRDLVDERQLSTFTADQCLSACTLVYAAGKQRLLGPNATLGFHQYAFPGVHQSAFRRQYEEDKHDWLSRGFDRNFVQRAYATPPEELWRPPHRELFRSRFVTRYSESRETARAGIDAGPELWNHPTGFDKRRGLTH